MRIRLIVSYDGSNYCGFQKQPNVKTIQGEIEKVLEKTFKKYIKTIGASRTDAKVHALDQSITFDIDEIKMKPCKIAGILNRKLPKDIRIIKSEETKKEFHPRYNAKKKIYEYRVINDDEMHPIHRNYAIKVSGNIDMELMIKGSKKLIGTYDFRGFSNEGSDPTTTIRTIENIKITKENNIIIFEVIGNGFLYKMVRIIVGTLLDIGLGNKDIKIIDELLESKDRSKASKTAKPEGLTLKKIYYEVI